MKRFSLLVVLLAVALSANATPKYKAESKVGEGVFKAPISYLAINGGMVYALETNGTITLFDTETGKQALRFMTGLSNTQSMAINEDGEIFVFSTTTRQEERTHQNRKYKVDVPIGVICNVFDEGGNLLRELKLDCLQSAKAAKFVDGTLAVGDLGQRKLVFINPETGKSTAEVKNGLRLCCGIFDFCVGPKNTLAVANLGAFQVQEYNMKGKKVDEFGQRGKGLDDFQGCCNPVSVGYLPDGSIVTVEKDPTRIKIYNKRGERAEIVEGVENLVKGCSYIPVAIDDEGNVFLAASRKGYLVKCVPKS